MYKNRNEQILLQENIKNIFQSHPDFMEQKIDLQFVKLINSMIMDNKPSTLIELSKEIRAVKIDIMEGGRTYALQ